MAYKVYDTVKGIYDAKSAWTAADKAGDKKKAQAIAEDAKKLYDELAQNGYGDVAKKLSSANLDQAKTTHDYYAKTGRTKGGDYLGSLGKAYGLTDSQIAGLTSYDATTGEMSFGGKNIGKPDAMVDGTSYWTDTGVLKSAFDDYISRTGTTRSASAFVNQENENLIKQYQSQLDSLKNTNPFETAEGKAILAKYDLSGLNARDNEIASQGASNGGNIDSFAAANALRQQAALVSQGQDAVLASHQQKLDNAMALLEGMGVHIDRVYSQDETSKNNQVARDAQTAEVTGVVPDSMAYSNNPFFNSDGTLRDMETDYQSIINNAENKLKTTTNAAEKADLEATIKYAKQARAYKVQNNPAYAKWKNTLSLYAPEKTEASRQFDETTAYNKSALQAEKDMNAANNASAERISAADNATQRDIAAMETYGDAIGEYTTAAGVVPLSLGNTSIPSKTEEVDYEEKLSAPYQNASDNSVKRYIANILQPLLFNNTLITPEEIRNSLIDNSAEYDIEVADMKRICDALGIDSKWIANYKDGGLFGWGSGVKEIK